MLNKKVGLVALLTSVAASGVWAGTITNYAVGDVLVCFRKGGNDMVVDAGQISTLTNFVAANHPISITQYTGTQLAQVGTNGVSWSAFTWESDNTLFVTRPRDTANSQTAPWQAYRSSVQSQTVLDMQPIVPGALDQLNELIYPASTSTAVIEQDNSSGNKNYPDGISYSASVNGSAGGQFNGTFQGNPENTTPDNFTTSGAVVRSDFYQLTPTFPPAPGKWLGYFELSTNGAMTFVQYPSSAAFLVSITRSGGLNTIQYTTGLYGTYTLRGTNSLTSGTPMASWPAIATLSTGDTANHTYMDSTADDTRFYIITAQ